MKFPSTRLLAHGSWVSPLDDRRKCQTSTGSAGGAGDLPWGLGDQPSWRTQNWCDERGVLTLCRDRYEQQRRRERVRDERLDNTRLGDQPSWRTQNWCDERGVLT